MNEIKRGIINGLVEDEQQPYKDSVKLALAIEHMFPGFDYNQIPHFPVTIVFDFPFSVLNYRKARWQIDRLFQEAQYKGKGLIIREEIGPRERGWNRPAMFTRLWNCAPSDLEIDRENALINNKTVADLVDRHAGERLGFAVFAFNIRKVDALTREELKQFGLLGLQKIKEILPGGYFKIGILNSDGTPSGILHFLDGEDIIRTPRKKKPISKIVRVPKLSCTPHTI